MEFMQDMNLNGVGERPEAQGQSSRIDWIDAFKGILIILVVLGHCSAPMTKWIYLFHMPAFIFLSGYTEKHGGDEIIPYICKKAKRILLPYLVWNLVFIAFYSFLSARNIFLFYDQPFSITVGDFVKDLATADLGGATWFLVVIFEISILYRLLYRICASLRLPQMTPFIGMIAGVFGFQLCRSGQYLPYLFDLALYGLLYYSMGQLCFQKDILSSRIPKKEMLVLCVLVFYIFGFLYPELMMNWPTRSFIGFLENIISSFCGIYFCYRVSLWVCGESSLYKRFLVFWGKHTISVLISHFCAFRVAFYIFYLLGMVPIAYLQNLTPTGLWPMQWLAVTIMTLALCWCVAVVSDRLRSGRIQEGGR